jgi:predicted anti-sigma-YlaC factor YlaD
MNHQPYESWMVDEIHLSLEQEITLQQHLAECKDCRKLHTGWQAAHQALKTRAMFRPAPGFSQRFSVSLAQRRALQNHQRQIRNLILGLSLSVMTTAVLLAVVIFAVSSPVEILVRTTEVITGLIGWWNRASRLLIASFQQPVFLAIWVLLTSGISLLAFGWLFTLWRISLQGAEQQ